MDKLRLVAFDEEDLQIISAECQDSLLRPPNIEFSARRRVASMEINRFVWNITQAGRTPRNHERRLALLSFSSVTQMQGNSPVIRRQDTILALLAIEFQEMNAPAGKIILHFSGGARIMLMVECIDVQLCDLGAAWAAASRPAHTFDGDEGQDQ